MTKTVLAIGECMVEVASTGGTTCKLGFAGDTFNTAWHMRRALSPGFDVQYLTTLGDDDLSDQMLAFMESQAIGTRHITRQKGGTPGLYLITLKGGERSFTYWRNHSAARHLADDMDHLRHAIDSADEIFLSGITLAILAPFARTRLIDALRPARAQGKMLAFDSNIRPRLWPDLPTMRQAIMDAAAVATLVLPTLPDETDLFGEADADALARRYQAAGVAEIVAKAGEHPAILFGREGRMEISPPRIVTPVDTTGAGDSFNGAYLAARLEGADMATATLRAHANAARVIQHHGALV